MTLTLCAADRCDHRLTVWTIKFIYMMTGRRMGSTELRTVTLAGAGGRPNTQKAIHVEASLLEDTMMGRSVFGTSEMQR